MDNIVNFITDLVGITEPVSTKSTSTMTPKEVHAAADKQEQEYEDPYEGLKYLRPSSKMSNKLVKLRRMLESKR